MRTIDILVLFRVESELLELQCINLLVVELTFLEGQRKNKSRFISKKPRNVVLIRIDEIP